MDENEKTLLLDRTYECPICEHKIKAKSVKTSVAKFVETKADLRYTAILMLRSMIPYVVIIADMLH